MTIQASTLQAPKKQRHWFTAQMVILTATALDFFGMIAASMTAAFAHPGFGVEFDLVRYSSISILGALALVVSLIFTRSYGFGSVITPMRQLSSMITSWAIAMAFVTMMIFVFKEGENLSRLWLLGWATSGFLMFIAWRMAYGAFIRKLNSDSHFNKRAVLVGGGDNAAQVVSLVNESRDAGVSLLGIFDDRGPSRGSREVNGLAMLGRIDDLVSYVRSNPVDILIVTLPTTAESRLAQLMEKLWILPVNIRLSAARQRLRYTAKSYSYVGGLPCLNLYDKPLGEWGPLLKEVMDKIIAVVALIMLSPVLIITAIAVKLDSKGPIFFKQNRYGFNNELIGVYKFRSMYTDKSDASASKLVTKGDPRVTRVGRFIRKTTIDELPQLFNVLKGELSLVGPRPHATQAKAGSSLYENVVSGYFARHRVKPGLTGWAQVNGWRGETDTFEKIERRVEYDLYYIENWSLTFDLYILARTPIALLNTKNAY